MFFFPRKKKQPNPPPPAANTTPPPAARQGASTRGISDNAVQSTGQLPAEYTPGQRSTRTAHDVSPGTSDHPLADYESARLLYSPRPSGRPQQQQQPPAAQHQQQPRFHDPSAGSTPGNNGSLTSRTDQQHQRSRNNSINAGRQLASARGGPSDAAGAHASEVAMSARRPSTGPSGPAPVTAAGHHEIVMDFGDVYTGAISQHPERSVTVPHGHGTLQSARGRHCYVGGFRYQQRHGWGKLVTPKFAMWGAWKDNRPDLATAVRLDTPDGAKYCGYVESLSSPAPTTSEPVSRFSTYILATSFVKSGWGEMVYSDGRRYFGQWQHDYATGFGVMLHTDGERYVGQWRKGQFQGTGVHCASNRLVYDGLWNAGRFVCSNGDVVFPRQVRLRGDWDDAHRFKNAKLIVPERRSMDRRYVITSVFDPLFAGGSEATRRKAMAAAAPLREAFDEAETLADLDKAFVAHLRVNESFVNTLKIVRRVFFFLYGTCGSSSMRGAGQKGNSLGWCYLRKSFGGCIHRATGTAITEATVIDAMGDVLSFVVSARRWFMQLLGPSKEAVDELDASPLMSRRILDALMELIHAPFVNLYRHAYAAEQLVVDAALQRLGTITMDDIGVSFGRGAARDDMLFVPYAAAMTTLQRLGKAHTFSQKLNVLVRWTVDIDDETRMNQIRLQSDEEMGKVAAFYERRRQMLRDDPDAIPPAAPDELDSDGEQERHGIASAMNIVGGSLDDLFPIHQFVLMRAKVPELAAHARMISDFADVEWLLDSTSRESFCVTNFKACVSVVAELHPAIRDPTGVVAPTSALLRRVEDVAERLSYGGDATVGPAAAAYLATFMDWLAVSADGDGDAPAPATKAAAAIDEETHTAIVVPMPCSDAGEHFDIDAASRPYVFKSTDVLGSADAVREGFHGAPFQQALSRFAAAINLHLFLVAVEPEVVERANADGHSDAAEAASPEKGAANGGSLREEKFAAFEHTPVPVRALCYMNPEGKDSAPGSPVPGEFTHGVAGKTFVLVASGASALGRCPRELHLVADALAKVAGVHDGVAGI